MPNMNTLEAYQELIAEGMPEEQASAQVHALNKTFKSSLTKHEMSPMFKEFSHNMKVFITWHMVVLFLALLIMQLTIRR